jgi:hypothetical protein
MAIRFMCTATRSGLRKFDLRGFSDSVLSFRKESTRVNVVR